MFRVFVASISVLQDILHFTELNHPDFELLVRVLTELEKMASSIHEARKRSDNLHKILEIQNSISGGKVVC
jgi:hypothetical protein